MPTPTLVAAVPPTFAVQVVRTTDCTFDLLVKDADGAAVDLTGDTFSWVAKTVPGGTVKFTVAGQLQTQSGATLGYVRFALSAANLTVSDADDPTTWWFEIQRVHAGQNTVVALGTIELRPRV